MVPNLHKKKKNVVWALACPPSFSSSSSQLLVFVFVVVFAFVANPRKQTV
jgi:hypothetical protein